MGIWDSITDIFSGGGRSDTDEGYKKAQGNYNEAQGYMRPYQQSGAQDYSNYRNWVANYGGSMPGMDTGNWQASQINQSPADYYNHIMSGYNESPQAKFEQDQAMRAANAGGSASGMLGSGAYTKAVQQNASDISGRDQQRYFGNVMGANQMQMGYLDDVRNRQNQMNSMQQYLTNLGYGASGAMGGNAMQQGQNNINQGLARSKFDQNAFDSIMGMIGAGGQNYKNNSMANAGGGDQIPWYMMMM